MNADVRVTVARPASKTIATPAIRMLRFWRCFSFVSEYWRLVSTMLARFFIPRNVRYPLSRAEGAYYKPATGALPSVHREPSV